MNETSGPLTIELSGRSLTLEQIASVATGKTAFRLSNDALERIQATRAVVEKLLGRGDVVYGVNTGFGKLADIRIPESELEALQVNLVRSHACGLGAPLSEQETRALMVLRANVLALGYSGCRAEIVERLLQMLEAGVHPVIPEKGSVGASGDLAPLAHLALSMIGEGETRFRGQLLDGGAARRENQTHSPGRQGGARGAEWNTSDGRCRRTRLASGPACGGAG